MACPWTLLAGAALAVWTRAECAAAVVSPWMSGAHVAPRRSPPRVCAA
jgi:hypothetical protein